MTDIVTPPAPRFPFLRRSAWWLILGVVVVKQIILVATVPAWLVPDEAAHLQYTRTLFLEGRIPELRGRLIVYDAEMEKFFQRTDRRLIGREDRKKIELERYWVDRPAERSAAARYNPAGAYSPVYYGLVGWPLWLIADRSIDTQLLTLRLVSSLLLLVVVAMTWSIAKQLTASTGFAAAAALLVGFHPGLSINFAGINNDAGLIAGGALILAWLARWWRQRPSTREVVFVAMAAGLSTLIKPVGASLVILTAVTAFMVFGWRRWVGWRMAALVAVLGGGLGSIWMIREQVLGHSSFLLDPDLWKIQSRLLEDVTVGTVLRGDLTYWWPAAFFTYWGEYFARTKIPTVLPLGYFFIIVLAGLAAIVGLIRTGLKRIPTGERQLVVFSLIGIIVHEAWLWLVHLQTVLRFRDFHFLYHGRYRFLVAPLVMMLLMLGLEKLFPAHRKIAIRIAMITLMVSASGYVGWIAAHI